MSTIIPDQPNELADWHRYVYVIEFDNGTLKVGQTKNPTSRLATHAQTAKVHGHAIARHWVSPPHRNHTENENALIAFCAERWPVSSGREHFQASDFDAVVEYAQGLPFTPVSPAEVELSDAKAKAFMAMLGRDRAEAVMRKELELIRQRIDLVALLANEANRPQAQEAFFALAKEVVGLSGPAWAASDPTASQRYLEARGAKTEVAAERAAEFELSMRTLYALQYQAFPEAFEDLARFVDNLTGGAE